MNSKLIINIMADISDYKAKATEVESMTKKMSGVITEFSEASSRDVNTWGQNWEQAGNKMGTAGAAMSKFVSLPIAGVLGASAGAAIVFEEAFAGVRKTVDASEAEFARLNKRIREMSTEMPATTTELANVMEIAGQLGIAAKDLDKFTEVAVNLGVATNMSSEQAATQMARLVTIMGETEDAYERIGSTVVDLGNNYATTESEIMNMTMRLAGAGKVAGYSTADIMGISTALTSVGISAEAGGTSMSKLMSSINMAAKVGTKQMKELEDATGLTYEQIYLMSENSPKDFKTLAASMNLPASEMKKVAKAGWDLSKMSAAAGLEMEEFADIVEKRPTEALNKFLIGLFDTENNGKDAIAMLNEMGINSERLRDVILRAGGAQEFFNQAIVDGNKAWEENSALQDEVEKKYETTASQLKMAMNAVKNLGIEIGNQLIPYIKDFARVVNDMAKKVGQMDPRTVERLVKAATKLALAGPALSILGKTISTIGKGAQGINKVTRAFDAFTSNFSKAKDIMGRGLDGYWQEGGWDISKILQQGLTTDSEGRVRGSHIVKANYDEYIKSVGGANEANLLLNKSSAKLASTQANLSNMLVRVSTGSISAKDAWAGMKTAGSNLVSSPIFKGGIWITLGAHLLNNARNSESFKRGLHGLADTMPTIGKPISALIGWVGGMTKSFFDAEKKTADFTFLIGGVGAVLLGLGGPLGWAAAAVGGLSLVFKTLGDITKDSATEQQRHGEIMSRAAQLMEDGESTYDRYSKEHLPALKDSLNKLYEASEDGTVKLVDFEDLEEQKAAFAQTKEEVLEYLGNFKKEELATMAEYGEKAELLEDENYQKQIEARAQYAEKRIMDAQTIFTRIEEINKLEEQSEGELTEALVKERESLFQRLNEIVDREELQEQIRRDLSKESLIAHFKETGELTEENAETLAKIQKEEYEASKKLTEQFYVDSLTEHKIALDSGLITQEEYNDLVAGANELFRDQTEKETKAHFNTLLDEFGIFSEEDRKKMDENAIMRQGMRDAEQGKDTKAAQQYFKTVEGMTNKEFAEYKKSLKNSEDHYQSKIKEFLNMLEEMGVLPKEVAAIAKDADGKWDLSFLGVEVGEEVAAAAKEAETKGGWIAEGLAKGMNAGRWLVRQAGKLLGRGAHEGLNEEMKYGSPSKVMKKKGAWISEGLAIGIEDELGAVEDASKSLASAAMIDDLSSDYSVGVERHVSTQYANDYNVTMARLVSDAIATELTKRPLRATIGEDDFEEGVSDVIYHEMRRG